MSSTIADAELAGASTSIYEDDASSSLSDSDRTFDCIIQSQVCDGGRKCPRPHRVLDVVAERRHQQRQPLPVGHGVEGPAEQADGVDGLGHVGHVGPAVVGVGGHVAADCADKVADGAPAD